MPLNVHSGVGHFAKVIFRRKHPNVHVHDGQLLLCFAIVFEVFRRHHAARCKVQVRELGIHG